MTQGSVILYKIYAGDYYNDKMQFVKDISNTTISTEINVFLRYMLPTVSASNPLLFVALNLASDWGVNKIGKFAYQIITNTKDPELNIGYIT